jgi:hypothetical protein
MPALVAGIHVLSPPSKDVDGRNKSGHDENQAVQRNQQNERSEESKKWT